MKNILLAIFGLVLLCGCQTNYYADKYTSALAPGTERLLVPHTGTAEVIRVDDGDMAAETKKYEARGYTVVGVSKFKADSDNYSAALNAVNSMGGTGGYIQSQGGRTPASSMSTPSAAENMVGPSVANAVPESLYRAVFLRRHVVLLGANLEPHGTQGLAVASVVDGSPAQAAGIRPGDIVVAVDGEPVADLVGYKRLIDARAGKRIHLTVSRDGAETAVDVQLNSLPGGS
jgi:membrane-associated protease RseP (regulator of RpoE activity)